MASEPVPHGELCEWHGEEVYAIRDVHLMAPFFCAVPSDGDLWLFASSRGGLSAGRGNADHALFPYETVDRLHLAHHHTGPFTCLRVTRDGRTEIVEPLLSDDPEPGISRHLYKSTAGNALGFEEEDAVRGLTFSQRWQGADDLGFIRSVTVTNTGLTPVALEMLDGLRNLQPGASR